MKPNPMRKPILTGLACIVAAMALTACSSAANTAQQTQTPAQNAAVYHKISAQEAKAVIDSGESAVILDVREQSEYDAGHIPNAVLLPLGSIEAKAAEALPDKDQKILVYCRSGNRSKTAVNLLVSLGYTQVYDFGGIIDWPYGTVAY